jgi:hypothetical protein
MLGYVLHESLRIIKIKKQMKNFIKIVIVTFYVLAGIFCCVYKADETETKETVLKGNATVPDETNS